jgi:WD40 repeat protein
MKSIICKLAHYDPITCVDYTKDAKKILSGSSDHEIKIWDTFSGN